MGKGILPAFNNTGIDRTIPIIKVRIVLPIEIAQNICDPTHGGKLFARWNSHCRVGTFTICGKVGYDNNGWCSNMAYWLNVILTMQ